MDFQASIDRPVVARTAVGSLDRSFMLPIELSGVSMTINGAAVGLRSVSRHSIEFVTPPALTSSTAGVSQDLVLFNNGVVMKTKVTIVPARPDVFNIEGIIGPGGRTKIFNVTNRVHTREPFTVRTVRIKPFGLVPTVVRVYLTGVINSVPTNTVIRIGAFGALQVPILTSAVQVEPGVYTIDFTLPSGTAGGGDQPLIVTVIIEGVRYESRLDDTATRFRIL